MELNLISVERLLLDQSTLMLEKVIKSLDATQTEIGFNNQKFYLFHQSDRVENSLIAYLWKSCGFIVPAFQKTFFDYSAICLKFSEQCSCL